MEKKKIITSYEKLPPNIVKLVDEEYPDGYQYAVKKIEMGPDRSFYAFPLETEETSYLVKVRVKIDENIHEEKEKFLFGTEESKESSTKEENIDEIDENDILDE